MYRFFRLVVYCIVNRINKISTKAFKLGQIECLCLRAWVKKLAILHFTSQNGMLAQHSCCD